MSERIGAVGLLRVYELTCSNVNRSPFVGDDLRKALRIGDAKLCVETHNKIVDTGMDVFSAFLSNNVSAPLVGGNGFETLADITVSRMEIGDAENPPTPANSDIVGVGSLQYLPSLIVTYPARFQTLFSGIIPPSECNGKILTEEALKLQNGKLFARTTFSKSKDDTKGLQFDHLVYFSRI